MAACTSTPSKPAESALRAALRYCSMMPGISASASVRGVTKSRGPSGVTAWPSGRIAEGATGGPAAESNLPHVSADADWFQSAAIWVCPLH